MFGSLKSKLLSAFAIGAVATALVGYFGLQGVHNVNTQLITATRDTGPSWVYTTEIRGAFFRALWETGRGIIAVGNGRPERARASRQARDKAFGDIDKAVAAFDAIPITPPEVGPWRDVMSRLRAYRQVNDQIWQQLDAGDPKAAVQTVDSNAAGRDTFLEAVDIMVEIERKRLDQSTTDGEAAVAAASKQVWAIMILGVLSALGLGIWLTLSITRPVERLKQAALRIAQGDINQKIEHQGKDEIGALADSFRSLVSYIGGIAEVASALGSGNLSMEIQPKSDADLLSKTWPRRQTCSAGLLPKLRC